MTTNSADILSVTLFPIRLFGIDWKREQDAVKAEADKGDQGRFAAGLPKISDGQQLFVLNGLSKLSKDGRMAIIQDASALYG